MKGIEKWLQQWDWPDLSSLQHLNLHIPLPAEWMADPIALLAWPLIGNLPPFLLALAIGRAFYRLPEGRFRGRAGAYFKGAISLGLMNAATLFTLGLAGGLWWIWIALATGLNFLWLRRAAEHAHG